MQIVPPIPFFFYFVVQHLFFGGGPKKFFLGGSNFLKFFFLRLYHFFYGDPKQILVRQPSPVLTPSSFWPSAPPFPCGFLGVARLQLHLPRRPTCNWAIPRRAGRSESRPPPPHRSVHTRKVIGVHRRISFLGSSVREFIIQKVNL